MPASHSKNPSTSSTAPDLRSPTSPSDSYFSPGPPAYPPIRLTESQVLDAFHRIVKSTLTSAVAAHLFTPDQLESQDSQAILAGPSLALLDGALRSDDSLTIPLDEPPTPGGTMPPNSQGLFLSAETCPETFAPLLRVWAGAAPRIRALSPQEVDDLRRFLAGVPGPAGQEVRMIGSTLNGLAINISQRRTFQQRINADLEHASRLGSAGPDGSIQIPHVGGGVGVGAAEEVGPSAPRPSSRVSIDSIGYDPGESLPDPRSEALMNAIRESLYAALADVLQATPALAQVARIDRARFYFGAVALALAHASRECVIPAVTENDVEVRPAFVKLAVGPPLRRDDCPPHLRHIHTSLVKVQKALDRMDQLMMMSEEEIDAFDRLEDQLVGHSHEDVPMKAASRRTIRLAQKLDRMAREITGMRAFRDRQEDVFGILTALSGLSDVVPY